MRLNKYLLIALILLILTYTAYADTVCCQYDVPGGGTSWVSADCADSSCSYDLTCSVEGDYSFQVYNVEAAQAQATTPASCNCISSNIGGGYGCCQPGGGTDCVDAGGSCQSAGACSGTYLCGGQGGSTPNDWEDCSNTPATDTDAGDTPGTAGTCSVYSSCSGGACTSSDYADTCGSTTSLTEYYNSANTCLSRSYLCVDFEQVATGGTSNDPSTTSTCIGGVSAECSSNTFSTINQVNNTDFCVDPSDCYFNGGAGGGNCDFREYYSEDSADACTGIDACTGTQDYDPDTNSNTCNECVGATKWALNGEVAQLDCCGDDSGENYLYYEQYSADGCNDITNEDCVGLDDDGTDNSCCDTSTDCVLGNSCYNAGFGPVDLDGDGVDGEFCRSGGNTWQDCDASEGFCTSSSCGSKTWITGGESSQFGEYDSGSETECCEDDSGEYFLENLNVSTQACCGESNNCVDNASQCINDGQPGFLISDGGRDQIAVCNGGTPPTYEECDDSESLCNVCAGVGSTTWSTAGETCGEYGSSADGGDGITECCGDDAIEFYVTTGVGSGSCCDAASDCVDSNNTCFTGTEICQAPTNPALYADEDCDGETDYDSQDGYIGDASCPVQIINIDLNETIARIGSQFEVNCTVTPAGVNSVDVQVSNGSCNWRSWDLSAGIATFDCVHTSCSASTSVTCTVNASRSTQTGIDQADAITICSLDGGDCLGCPCCVDFACDDDYNKCVSCRVDSVQDRPPIFYGGGLCEDASPLVDCYANSSCDELDTLECIDISTICNNTCQPANRDLSEEFCIDNTGCVQLNWNLTGEKAAHGEYEGSQPTPECCGDDAGETFRYREIASYSGSNQVVDSYSISTDIKDSACCNDVTDCVFEGVCYRDFDEVYTINIGSAEKSTCEGLSKHDCRKIESCFWRNDACVYNVRLDSTYGTIVYNDVNKDGYDEVCDPGEWMVGDLNSSFYGFVYNVTLGGIQGATVQISGVSELSNATYHFNGTTDINGYYDIEVFGNGTYDIIVTKSLFGTDTEINRYIGMFDDIEINFTLMDAHEQCEPDCTYQGDSICHTDCNSKLGCSFFDNNTLSLCAGKQSGWTVDYNGSHAVDCCESQPYESKELKIIDTDTTLISDLVRLVRVVFFKGKPVKMVIDVFR